MAQECTTNIPDKFTHLNVLEGKLEGEGLVIVGIEGALLDRGLLLTDPFSILHQRHLHVGI